MKKQPLVFYTIEQSIAYIVLNRPEKHNALNKVILEGLGSIFDRLEKDDMLRVIVLKATGDESFCSGADIAEMAKWSVEEMTENMRCLQKIFLKISALKKPIIAQLHGFVLGGGLELALMAHFRLASEHTILGFPEVNLGLLPSYGGTQILPKIIGLARAYEMLLTGKKIDVSMGVQYGIVNEVHPLEKLPKRVRDLALTLAKKSPDAVWKIVQCLQFGEGISNDALDFERAKFVALFQSEYSQKKIRLFLKR